MYHYTLTNVIITQWKMWGQRWSPRECILGLRRHEILNRWENSPLWMKLREMTALWHHYQFISQKMWNITH